MSSHVISYISKTMSSAWRTETIIYKFSREKTFLQDSLEIMKRTLSREYWRNVSFLLISSRFSRNSEAGASEFLENRE